MKAVMNTRRGLAASAAVVVACILLLLFTVFPRWNPFANRPQPGLEQQATAGKQGSGDMEPPLDTKSVPTAGAQPPQPSTEVQVWPQAGAPTLASPSPVASEASGQASGGTSAPNGSSSYQAKSSNETDPTAPRFDLVRIEPTGDSVVAARAAPNSTIVLLDGGMPIASATADDSGQVALLPPPLKPGEHNLVLSVTMPGGGKVVSSQSIVVSVPDRPMTAPMVALIQPNQPAAILSGPVAGSAPGEATSAASGNGKPDTLAAAALAIQSVEVEDAGSFYATGKAVPGSKSRIYLNGSFVATVTADQFGLWSLKIQRGMKPGRYAVRADQIDPKSGKVAQRAEVPFDYPQQAGASLRKGLKTADAGAPQSPSTAQPASGAATATRVGAAGRMGATLPLSKSATGVASGLSAATGTASGAAREPNPRIGDAATLQASKGAGLRAGGQFASSSDPKIVTMSGDGEADAAGVTLADPETATSSGNKALASLQQLKASVQTQDAGMGQLATSPSLGGAVANKGSLGSKASNVATMGVVPAEPAKASTASADHPSDPDQHSRVGLQEGTNENPAPSQAMDSTPAAGRERLASNGGVARQLPALTTIVRELLTAKVIRGDSLWRISRKMLGHGIRYTQIYAVNTQQIRDPSLIYPGQVLVVPQKETP